MKKFIAAAAGLALAGTMATTAMAEVNFGGSARARMLTMQDYSPEGSVNKLDSRVRLKVEAKSKGGATASARIRMADGMWDGGNGATGNAGDDKNIWVDYGYIAVPMGAVTVSAGRQIANFSPWFAFDGRKDRLKMVYKNAGTSLALFYDKNAELTDPTVSTATLTGGVTNTGGTASTDPATGASTVSGGSTSFDTTGLTTDPSADWTDDNDKNGYGIVFSQKFGETGWMAKAIAVYGDDETAAANDSIVGSLHVAGAVQNVNVQAEISMKDFDNADDTQMGGYALAAMKFGAATVGVIGGMTKDGFSADDDFGTHMIGNGNNSPITVASNIGAAGDTVFGVGHFAYKVSDALSMDAFFTFATIDDVADLIELSAGAVYTISEGAALTVAGGAVIPSWDDSLGMEDDTMIGAYTKLEIKY
jgi:hypothetical protein